ncbi:MAG: AAA family ATPase, partial [Chloroflexota bacterium]
MFKQIEINHYRGIQQLKIEDLAQINIFVGFNGAGKSTVLEAISLAAAPSVYQHVRLARYRGLPAPTLTVDESLRSIFFINGHMNGDGSTQLMPATIKTNDKDGLQQTLTIEVLSQIHEVTDSIPLNDADSYIKPFSFKPPLLGIKHTITKTSDEVQDTGEQRLVLSQTSGKITGNLDTNGSQCYFVEARQSVNIADLTNRLSEIFQTVRKKKIFLAALQHILPTVQDIQIGMLAQQPLIYADVGQDWLLPIDVLGDGFNRAFLILVGLMDSLSNIIIVDEIDSGLHPFVMESFWEDINELTEGKDQLFCSTHNDEILLNLLDVFKDSPEKIRLYRI